MFNRSRTEFNRINTANGLTLDFTVNQTGFAVLQSIFGKREYADYFPFYEDSIIVDVGAHFGYFSLFAAKNAGPGSKIIAIEPDPNNQRILQRNMADCRSSNVTVIEGAMGGSEGTLKLYGGSEINRSLFSAYALGNGKVVAEVPVMTLSRLMVKHDLHQIDFLKLDCEGAEYDILFGAEDDLLAKIKTISMEFHDMKSREMTGIRLHERLKKAGFTIVKFVHEPSNLGLNYGKLIATRI
jgi:FkbM family methyltransferase